MTRDRDKLEAALHELAASTRQGASPELELALKDAFRRHHVRRRRTVMMRVGILSLCFASLAASFLLRRSPQRNGGQAEVRMIPSEEVHYPAPTSTSRTIRPALIRKASANRSSSTLTTAFVPLPSLEMVTVGDELRVVRLEMPGEDLRLLGAPVTEEIAARRVTADFVVGHDGTAYAVRLVRTRF